MHSMHSDNEMIVDHHPVVQPQQDLFAQRIAKKSAKLVTWQSRLHKCSTCLGVLAALGVVGASIGVLVGPMGMVPHGPESRDA